MEIKENDVKEILYTQLELLAEYSKTIEASSDRELPSTSHAMLEIAKWLMSQN